MFGMQRTTVLGLKDVLDPKDLCSILTRILHSSLVVTFFGIPLPSDVLGLSCLVLLTWLHSERCSASPAVSSTTLPRTLIWICTLKI